MDSTTTNFQSFSTNVPFKQPIVITHYISIAIASLGCYPLLLTRQIRRRRGYLVAASLFFGSIGLVSSYFIQLSQHNTASFLLYTLGALLTSLVSIQSIILYSRSTTTSNIVQQQQPQQKYYYYVSAIQRHLSISIPKWVDLALGWAVLVIAFSYMTLAALVFTESCNDSNGNNNASLCLMPVAIGTGFILYGTLTLLHLLAIVQFPRSSTPEYYEGVVLTFWGFLSLFFAGTPILGTEWRALNLGLLWFTGGLFSISLNLQSWAPALREKNIVNCLIICLTGRAIVTGLTQTKDNYAEQVHTMLGYVLSVGALARLIQIVFRKSPVDNLPRHMFQHIANATDDDEIDHDEEEIVGKDLTTALPKKCKHKLISASITLVSGLLVSLLSICGGILFMGANVGWLRYMRFYVKEPSIYVNITLAVSFIWAAYVFGLCTIYKNLKTHNAIHQYEYLELENNNAHIVDQPPMSARSYHYQDSPIREWSAAATTTEISTSANMNNNSSPLEFVSTSPTFVSAETLISSIISKPNEPKPDLGLEKTIRPSELRAKRRSLLVQSPTNNSANTATRKRSSSNFGVGGVLPDEITNTPTLDSSFRKSWLSSSSSVGYYSGSIDSSTPDSPLLDRPYASISSTLPLNNQEREATRRNSLNEPSFESVNSNNNGSHVLEFPYSSTNEDEAVSHDYLLGDTERRRSVHKTESGKRKERRLMNQCNYSDGGGGNNIHSRHSQ